MTSCSVCTYYNHNYSQWSYTTMAHNIMDNRRFYALRTPAWHTLGTVSTEPLDAIAAADKAGISALKTFAAPAYVRGHAGFVKAGGFQALCGCLPGHNPGGEHVTTPDGTAKTVYTYGMVSATRYEPIFHHTALARMHEATNGAIVETIGLLGHGETLFVTYQLPHSDIKGDKLHNYVMLMNPLDGMTAVAARTTGVRVVCQNTLSMALKGSTEHQFRAAHTAGVTERLAAWLAGVWADQCNAIQAIAEACTLLADTGCLTGQLAMDILPVVYPYPEKPAAESPLLDTWNERCLKQATHRNLVRELFDTSHTNSQATKGTLWGAYNAVCEYEDHARARASARSRWLGEGAERKARAFAACTALATV